MPSAPPDFQNPLAQNPLAQNPPDPRMAALPGRTARARHPAHPLRFIRRNRRAVAATLAGCAALLATRVAAGEQQSVPVVVAASSVAAGHRLTDADLQVRQYPPDLAPAGALADSATLVGQVSAVAVTAGEVFSEARLLSRRLVDDPQDPERLPMPLRLADAEAAALLRAGNRVDILAAPLPDDAGQSSRARVVARNILVLSVTGQTGSAAGLLGGEVVDQGAGALILISANQEQAVLLAGAADRDLTFVVR